MFGRFMQVHFFHPDVFIFKLRYNTLNIFNRYGVNSGKRFVKKNKIGIGCHRASDFDPSASDIGSLQDLSIAAH